MLIDRYNRVHDYLRISLTDNCNLRCFYCMPDEEYDFTPASKLMQPDEIFALSKIFVQQGVKKIRLTGGEPLVRRDAATIISSLSTLPVELTLTTNATRLDSFFPVLQEANVKSINISLDTLREDRFTLITRRPLFSHVITNIQKALLKNLRVKVNVVVMRGINEDEINDFVEWTRDVPIHIRFIEFMPFSGNHWSSRKVVSLADILSAIQSNYTFHALNADVHDTAKIYKITGHAGTFGVISTMTEPFCAGCNRMRLTADGKLKNCLFSKGETDLLGPFRRGENVLGLIEENIWGKERELGGQFTTALKEIDAIHIENRSMITIGG